MAANNPTIKKNATSLTVVGGTDAIYTKTSKVIPGGVEVSELAVTDFRVRPTIEAKSRTPVLGPDGVFTKRKTDMKLVFPALQADGSIVFDVWRLTAETSVTTSAADVTDRRMRAAQGICAATFDNLWNNGVTE